MRRAWTRFWLSASTVATVGAAIAAPAGRSHRQISEAQRRNELTVAGLRPGKDFLSKAIRLYGEPSAPKTDRTSPSWEDACRQHSLSVDTDDFGKILSIRVTSHKPSTTPDCARPERDAWRTGKNLIVSDTCARAQQIYGKPSSVSPSTKDGKPLELLYYAFDWAGPDVPQVMEVVCTREKDGKPGRVVEITLAAPSL